MRVLVDTSVWSLALRRRHVSGRGIESKLNDELGELIREGRAGMIGPIRQELLSGLSDETQFGRLRDYLRAFPDEPLLPEDYESAARISNRCRRAGLSGSPVDYLICAVSLRCAWAIFTTDNDFGQYSKVVPLELHRPR